MMENAMGDPGKRSPNGRNARHGHPVLEAMVARESKACNDGGCQQHQENRKPRNAIGDCCPEILVVQMDGSKNLAPLGSI